MSVWEAKHEIKKAPFEEPGREDTWRSVGGGREREKGDRVRRNMRGLLT